MTLVNSTKKVNEIKAQLIEDNKLKNHENVHKETKINTIAIITHNLNLAVAIIDSLIEGLTLTTGSIQEGMKGREETIFQGTTKKLTITGKSPLSIDLSISTRNGHVVGSGVPQARLKK